MEYSTAQHDAVPGAHAHDEPAAPARPDRNIVADVAQRLQEYSPLRVLPAPLNVQSEAGHVTLSGHVRGTILKRAAVSLARSVAGVLSVDESGLYADNELEHRVGAALAANPATLASSVKIGIRAMNGLVTMVAQDIDVETRPLIEGIAAAVPGVREAHLHVAAH